MDVLPPHPISFPDMNQKRTTAAADVRRRPGFHPTPFAQCPPPTKRQAPPLSRVNLEGTSVTSSGAESLLHSCSATLRSLRLDRKAWRDLLEEVGVGGGGGGSNGACAECMAAPGVIEAANLTARSAEEVWCASVVFPSLERLTLEQVREVEEEEEEELTLGEALAEFQSLKELTLRDVMFLRAWPHLKDCGVGERLTSLSVVGSSPASPASLDCALLAGCCPNLESLSATRALLAPIRRLEDYGRSGKGLFPRLKSLKLWEVRSEEGQLQETWKELIKRS